MRIMLLSVASTALLLTTPGVAQERVEKSTAAPTKMICKKFEGTGTRLKNRRVCATAEQWRQREKEDQELINKIQNDQTRLKT